MAGNKRRGDCWGDMGGEFGVQLINALNHEVRRKILRLLAETDEALSPAVMSKLMEIPLSTVSYHVNMLRRCGVVEQAGTQQVRGAIEHFYRSLVEDNEIARALLEATRRIDESNENRGSD